MKRLFNIVLVPLMIGFMYFAILPSNSIAQKWVSTEVEKRKVLLEEFTGIHCGYCPDGHRIATELVAANPEKVFLMNIHAGGYAVPAAGEVDLRTTVGTTLDAASGVSGYPAGSVNRSTAPWAMDRGKWTNVATNIMSQNSPVNIAVRSVVDVQIRKIKTTVEIYYTSTPQAGDRLNIFFTQDGILGTQSDYGNYNPTNWVNGKYSHNHVLRMSFNDDAWGSAVSKVGTGELITKTYLTDVPSIIGNIPVDLTKIRVLAFITSATGGNIYTVDGQEVTTSSFDKASLIDLKFTDKTVYPTTLNVPTLNPKVEVKNNSNKEITGFDLALNMNGVESVKSFSGSLKAGETTMMDWGVLPFEAIGVNQVSISGFENIAPAYLDTSCKNSNFKAFLAFKEKAFQDVKIGFNGSVQNNVYIDNSQNSYVSIQNGTYGANNTTGGLWFILDSKYSVSGKPASVLFGECDFTGKANPGLTYYYAYSAGSQAGTAPKIYVEVSEDWGLTFKTVNTTSCIETGKVASGQTWYIPKSAEYKLVTVDLKAYANKTVLVRVVGVPGTGGNDMWIDEVSAANVVAGQEISAIATLDYGTVAAKSVKQLEVTNTGGKNLTIYSAIIENDADDVFALESGIYGTVKPGEKKSFPISVTPKANKTYTAKLTISSDATNAANYVIDLKAVGNLNAGPAISSVKVLDFKTVSLKTTKQLEITNSGNLDLIISSGAFENNTDNAFSMDQAIYGTIKAGEMKSFPISVTPTANKTYTAKLTLSSNTANYSIDLTAVGNVTSVEDGIVGNVNVMTMSVGPNPFTSSSTLTYTVGGNTTRNVEINVIDASGKLVANLVKSNATPGVYTTSINANNLTSGAYYVISNVDGITSQLQVVIAK